MPGALRRGANECAPKRKPQRYCAVPVTGRSRQRERCGVKSSIRLTSTELDALLAPINRRRSFARVDNINYLSCWIEVDRISAPRPTEHWTIE